MLSIIKVDNMHQLRAVRKKPQRPEEHIDQFPINRCVDVWIVTRDQDKTESF